jgi:hypothetical protein
MTNTSALAPIGGSHRVRLVWFRSDNRASAPLMSL